MEEKAKQEEEERRLKQEEEERRQQEEKEREERRKREAEEEAALGRDSHLYDSIKFSCLQVAYWVHLGTASVGYAFQSCSTAKERRAAEAEAARPRERETSGGRKDSRRIAMSPDSYTSAAARVNLRQQEERSRYMRMWQAPLF